MSLSACDTQKTREVREWTTRFEDLCSRRATLAEVEKLAHPSLITNQAEIERLVQQFIGDKMQAQQKAKRYRTVAFFTLTPNVTGFIFIDEQGLARDYELGGQ